MVYYMLLYYFYSFKRLKESYFGQETISYLGWQMFAAFGKRLPGRPSDRMASTHLRGRAQSERAQSERALNTAAWRRLPRGDARTEAITGWMDRMHAIPQIKAWYGPLLVGPFESPGEGSSGGGKGGGHWRGFRSEDVVRMFVFGWGQRVGGQG